ncbi:MAG: lipid-binding SYLF domain-containing protein [Desulfarculaceae bacterium]|nr:lipid-binding SYLF domain-containing protein [Desulfarculaceae bacterium]MCF8072810.1 lipid-binding SYLF domain-containing protein [Desulfarculaceae bacterium]MCF8100978.1 lipid-binding SYLF domain-containing protein [Desulfarculaceae bacterium]MCF8118542.1 lipid-binding SYLF domain-containing protein [Desulfarculaceae bacterium]
MTISLACFCLLLNSLPVMAKSQAEEPYAKLTEQCTKMLEGFVAQKQAKAIRNMLGGARAIFLVPSEKMGGLIVGYERGQGALLRRHGKLWSDPVFLQASQVTVGLQAGATDSQVTMLIMTDQAVEDLIKGVSQFGGSGGFALGDMGLGTSGSGSVGGGLEVLTISTSSGAYLGTTFKNMSLSPAQAMNQAAYGNGMKMGSVLAQPGGKLAAAAKLRKILEEAVIKAWGK